MPDLLNRLHQLKMVLAGLILTAIGVGFIVVANQLEPAHSLSVVPFNELGGILVGAGILGIWIDQLFRREQDAADEHRLRSILKDEAPAMRDAVLEAFAANHHDLKRVSTPQTLDKIITNSLALRLDDQDFASDLFTDIRRQAIEAPERWNEAALSIDLASLGDTGTQNDYFIATVRWEYITTPHWNQRRFVCLSDRREYAELTATKTNTSAWFFKPDQNHQANDRAAFELLQFTVDGRDRPIRRTSRKTYQAYSVDLGADIIHAGQPVTISYTYQTITRKDGNLLFFDVEQPTRDLRIAFDYTGCGIQTISAIDLFPSIHPTRIEHTPPQATPKTVRVEVDGWTFPRSGVAFVWTLS